MKNGKSEINPAFFYDGIHIYSGYQIYVMQINESNTSENIKFKRFKVRVRNI